MNGASKTSSDDPGRAPRAFLSYSWDGAEHKRWVAKFAERLQGESGIELTFDGWHLNPGDDRLCFMEKAVAENDFVIMVCTPNYAERANERQGGVGYESMIITAELAEQIAKSKFIPVLRLGTWRTSLPIYLKSKVGVDLTEDPYSEDEYERLLRVVHGEPIQPPPIGEKPDFAKRYLAGNTHEPAVEVIDHSGPRLDSQCELSPRALILSPELSVRVFPVVHESSWSSKIELSVSVDSSEIDSFFSRLRGSNDTLVIAYGFDIALAKLDALDRLVSSGKALWKARFNPTRIEFHDDMEMGTSSTSADAFAEKRVRRLLLNENPMAFRSDQNDHIGILNEAMHENLVQGLNSVVKIERSIFIDLYTAFGTDPAKFVEIAWIGAIADLKLSAALQYIDHLALQLNRNILKVDFLGRRHRKYVNAPPYQIRVNGSLTL